MPRRDDIHKILIIGSGPIIIGQACEFDYSGSQACRALREEGYEVVLVNSNPATIMTDPEMANATYVEPIAPEVVARIIERERPDALLPTMGGQTGLNTAVKLAEMGVLDRYGVQLIGANVEAIRKAEERDLFHMAMARIGLDVPRGGFAHNMEEARRIVAEIGFPVVIRPSFTLGGTGGSVCYNIEEFEEYAPRGLAASMSSEILIEESCLGWKEIEYEVMRDCKDNVVIICTIENFDPMGVHTGDSITVAPVQTLTDREYQALRDACIACIREIGVETGGSNIQFAIHPETGRIVIIEMNPRVSRSSALASKATGFPIAKMAAKLAVGLTLDEIPNDITRETPASFEPTIDYCVVKIPRWAFEKFPGSDPRLTTMMKSVGETMAIGRNFREALQKGLRGLEIGRAGLGADGRAEDALDPERIPEELLRRKLSVPEPDRLFYMRAAFRRGMSVEEVAALTRIDPWFVGEVAAIVRTERRLSSWRGRLAQLPASELRRAKEDGFSDRQLARILDADEQAVRARRKAEGVVPVYKLVDTCAAEFEAYTPYFYSTYDSECEARVDDRRKIMILGGGPNRIGQGIEFDYCCVHASLALRELGFETIMVNSNPETVSTDYDISDKLYFEPLTFEDVMNIVERERPEGVIVQFGGQTPLNLAVPLERAGVPILGTPPDAIDRAEDRERFAALLSKLGLAQPENGTATDVAGAVEVARRIGFPVLVRPSYVLGGRAMEIVYDEESLERFVTEAADVSPGHPILIDRFLEDATEVDVDCVADGESAVICGVMEHIEEAGVHSGDSACVLPPHSLPPALVEEIKRQTRALALELGVVGLMNVQFAVKEGSIYVLEVNPRASRTVPFVSKATGVPWAKVAAKLMVGMKLTELDVEEVVPGHTSVKEVVLPFNRFPGVDIRLGPEMRSTGEVMGVDDDFPMAFAKSQMAAGTPLPVGGSVFISVSDEHKPQAVALAREFRRLGFSIFATAGTARALSDAGIEVTLVHKIHETERPNVEDRLLNGDFSLIINTPSGKESKADQTRIRSRAVSLGVPIITTMAAAKAAVAAIEAERTGELSVRSLQERHGGLRGR